MCVQIYEESDENLGVELHARGERAFSPTFTESLVTA